MLPFGTPVAFIFGPFSMQELLVVLLIALIFFGGKKIPEIGRGLGDGIRQFKSSLKGDDEDKAAGEKTEESKKEAA